MSVLYKGLQRDELLFVEGVSVGMKRRLSISREEVIDTQRPASGLSRESTQWACRYVSVSHQCLVCGECTGTQVPPVGGLHAEERYQTTESKPLTN